MYVKKRDDKNKILEYGNMDVIRIPYATDSFMFLLKNESWYVLYLRMYNVYEHTTHNNTKHENGVYHDPLN